MGGQGSRVTCVQCWYASYPSARLPPAILTEVPMRLIVDRRAVLIGLAATLVPSPAYAQKPPPRIGWLSAGSEPDPFLVAFRQGLQKLGYVEGQTVVLDIRHAHGDLAALRAGAAELAQSKVTLIVASLTAVRAARTIKDIPILLRHQRRPHRGRPCAESVAAGRQPHRQHLPFARNSGQASGNAQGSPASPALACCVIKYRPSW